ncbi:hypothetical protein BGY98DRAFT_972204 [Russula aff. rugulosa BPL654]|nr:hypothetical protein BGY98DRAFT_972204 [Russula aff. rugulosa BPL654]
MNIDESWYYLCVCLTHIIIRLAAGKVGVLTGVHLVPNFYSMNFTHITKFCRQLEILVSAPQPAGLEKLIRGLSTNVWYISLGRVWVGGHVTVAVIAGVGLTGNNELMP